MHLGRPEIINIQLFKINCNKLYIFVEQPNEITGVALRNPEGNRKKEKTHISFILHTI